MFDLVERQLMNLSNAAAMKVFMKIGNVTPLTEPILLMFVETLKKNPDLGSLEISEETLVATFTKSGHYCIENEKTLTEWYNLFMNGGASLHDLTEDQLNQMDGEDLYFFLLGETATETSEKTS